MERDKLFAAALKLPADDRADLAVALLKSLGTKVELNETKLARRVREAREGTAFQLESAEALQHVRVSKRTKRR